MNVGYALELRGMTGPAAYFVHCAPFSNPLDSLADKEDQPQNEWVIRTDVRHRSA